MHKSSLLAALFVFSVTSTAFAQRFPIETTIESTDPAILDVSTFRGAIDVTTGDRGRIVVRGTVTVRLGLNVPLDAPDIARRLAANPPIQRDGKTVRLRPPASEAELRAVTIAYQVEVPPETEVRAVTDSGAVAIRGVAGSVLVRTQSSRIDLTGLRGAADVTTGSGVVNIDGVGGTLKVATSSSAITLDALAGDTRIRTQSGAVRAAFTGPGDVDVQTGSSAITLRNVRGGLTVLTETGHVTAHGAPGKPWEVSTGSSRVDITSTAPAFNLDASNRSGTIEVIGAPVKGIVSKRQVAGTIGAGGPLVRIVSRSGSIHVTAPAAP